MRQPKKVEQYSQACRKFVGAIQDHQRKLNDSHKHTTKFCDVKSEENYKTNKES